MGFDQSITPSLLVTAGMELFAIPQENVSEHVRLTYQQAAKIIGERGNLNELYLRGSALPLFRLSDVLGIKRVFKDENGRPKPDRRVRMTDRRDPVSIVAEDARQWDERLRVDRRVRQETSTLNIVVVKTKVRQYGLVVDEIPGTAGIVVKPSGKGARHGTGYMGTALLGDGRTAFVLDPVGLAILAGLA